MTEEIKDDGNFKPGIHSVSYERYRDADGLSKSMIDILDESTPAHLRVYMQTKASDDDETPAKRFGIILHRALLEPDTYRDAFHVRPPKLSFSTKAGKQWRDEHKDKPIINSTEEKQITRMVSSVWTHSTAKRLLTNARTEQSLFAEDTEGVLRKCRIDALTPGTTIPDIKTVEIANLKLFERQVSKYRYHVQAAYYLDICKLLGIPKRDWFNILIEKQPPYATRCFQMYEEVVTAGRRIYQGHLQTWRNCLETDIWPAWGNDFEYVGLPDYEMRQLIALTGG